MTAVPPNDGRAVSMTAVLSAVFEEQSRATTRQPLRDQPSQSLRAGTAVEQAIAHEVDERIEFMFSQTRIRAQQHSSRSRTVCIGPVGPCRSGGSSAVV
jgi:hypothetical protein